MKNKATLPIILMLASLPLSGCLFQSESKGAATESHGESAAHTEGKHHAHKILVTSPIRKDVVSTQPYVAQIHSCQHIEICALEGGYLEEINVKEGQAVKKGDLMFKILSVVYQAKLNSEIAEANRIQIEFDNAKSLSVKGIVSPQEVAIKKADLAKAQANVMLAQAELNFTNIKAPFNGIVDRQRNQTGSLIDEGDVLTTFSDNSVMWVYFNVPEARYLEYKADLDKANAEAVAEKVEAEAEGVDDDDEVADAEKADDASDAKDAGHADDSKAVADKDSGDDDDNDESDDDASQLQIELRLANGKIFHQPGKIGAIEADFNNTTGNIAFRADFPNPDGLLRYGQTGTILIHRKLNNVIVIPQRATFEILAKRYVYVVDKGGVVHQRAITIQSVLDDIFVISKGVDESDKIILEGLRQVRDGDKIDYEFIACEKVLSNLKYHAE